MKVFHLLVLLGFLFGAGNAQAVPVSPMKFDVSLERSASWQEVRACDGVDTVSVTMLRTSCELPKNEAIAIVHVPRLADDPAVFVLYGDAGAFQEPRFSEIDQASALSSPGTLALVGLALTLGGLRGLRGRMLESFRAQRKASLAACEAWGKKHPPRNRIARA